MLHNNLNYAIPQEDRAEINEKILFVINQNMTEDLNITKEEIFNAYTGVGGLHHQNFKDHKNFHSYTKAKQEEEFGQFFTPHDICQKITSLFTFQEDYHIADISCGIGNFFNYLPKKAHITGCDIDNNALIVAKHLYPHVDFVSGSYEYFHPLKKMDVIVGNPPFNLKLSSGLSQMVFLKQCAAFLKDHGLLAFICPKTFLDDRFNSSQFKLVESHFKFIGQIDLGNKAFTQVGVENFGTKLVVLQRAGSGILPSKFEAKSYTTREELKEKIQGIEIHTNVPCGLQEGK